jgi:hypothetical protein
MMSTREKDQIHAGMSDTVHIALGSDYLGCFARDAFLYKKLVSRNTVVLENLIVAKEVKKFHIAMFTRTGSWSPFKRKKFLPNFYYIFCYYPSLYTQVRPAVSS